MSKCEPSAPLTTAAEIWHRLVRDGVLHPRTYDEDIVSAIDRQLPGSGALPKRMEVAGWTARELLRAMAPVVDSFAGLMRDLLSLYSDIAASSATNDNLLLSYEFAEGDALDQSLSQFRAAVDTVERALGVSGRFVVSPQRWTYPSAKAWHPNADGVRALRDGNRFEWDFSLPAPPRTDDASTARGASLVYAVLNAACDTLRNYGSTMESVGNNVRGAEEDTYKRLYFDFTDYWPEAVILMLRADLEAMKTESESVVESWLRKIEEWCASFWEPEDDDPETALEEVLSLPMWGKRHELYSAWVVCLFAAAFKSQRLQFRVIDGKLSFPFRATKIASFEDRYGTVELWSEVRSAASGVLAHGRKQGIQPDYRFLRPGQSESQASMAVEVKQYLRTAAARHGDTARDYASALPNARIVIVAHGPIGETALNRVHEADRSRVEFRENVRSLVSNEAKEFIAEMADAFPAVATVSQIDVEWTRVVDVELRLVEEHQKSDRNRVILDRGNPIRPSGSGMQAEIEVEIVCHPERLHTIDEAKPSVKLTFSDGTAHQYEPAGPNSSRRWHVGTIRDGVFSASRGSAKHRP